MLTVLLDWYELNNVHKYSKTFRKIMGIYSKSIKYFTFYMYIVKTIIVTLNDICIYTETIVAYNE